MFNCDLADTRKVGKELRESELLATLWPQGHHTIGTVTGASANYIAQYSLKKIGTQWGTMPPPFLRMSNRPGIGYGWLLKYSADLQNGYLVAKGHRGPIPRYYKNKLRNGEVPSVFAGENTTPVADRPPEGAPAQTTTLQRQLHYEQHIHPRITDHHKPLQPDHQQRLQDQEIIHKRYKQLTETRK